MLSKKLRGPVSQTRLTTIVLKKASKVAAIYSNHLLEKSSSMANNSSRQRLRLLKKPKKTKISHTTVMVF